MKRRASIIRFTWIKPARLARPRRVFGLRASRSASATTPKSTVTVQRMRGITVATQDIRPAKARKASYFTTLFSSIAVTSSWISSTIFGGIVQITCFRSQFSVKVTPIQVMEMPPAALAPADLDPKGDQGPEERRQDLLTQVLVAEEGQRRIIHIDLEIKLELVEHRC